MAESINDIRGQKIKELVEEMKLYKNPQEIEDMRKIMRKNVPLMMRGYLLAYLYVTRTDSKVANSNATSNANPTSSLTKSRKSLTQKPSLEDTTSFYINIGKASKSPARDMVDFICEKAGLTPDDIVSVVYKPNYSFVSIRNEKASGVIEAVTGQIYKGRKVRMNYSKDKDEQ